VEGSGRRQSRGDGPDSADPRDWNAIRLMFA
jgi:hypothetical protein